MNPGTHLHLDSGLTTSNAKQMQSSKTGPGFKLQISMATSAPICQIWVSLHLLALLPSLVVLGRFLQAFLGLGQVLLGPAHVRRILFGRRFLQAEKKRPKSNRKLKTKKKRLNPSKQFLKFGFFCFSPWLWISFLSSKPPKFLHKPAMSENPHGQKVCHFGQPFMAHRWVKLNKSNMADKNAAFAAIVHRFDLQLQEPKEPDHPKNVVWGTRIAAETLFSSCYQSVLRNMMRN